MIGLFLRSNVAFLDDRIVRNRFGTTDVNLSLSHASRMQFVYWDEPNRILVLASNTEIADRKKRYIKLCKLKNQHIFESPVNGARFRIY